MKRLFTFIFGIIVGVVLTIGGIVGGGYIVLSRKNGMRSVNNLLPGSITLSQEVQAKSILDFGKDVVGVFTNLDTLTVDKFEEAIGTTVLSEKLSDFLGKNVNVGESLVKNLPKTIAEGLTIDSVVGTMGVSLPDLPMFTSEEFLSSPLSTAFASLDEQTLDGIIVVVYEEDGDVETPPSSMFLQKLGKKTISDISTDMDGIINDTVLSDIITAAEEDSLITHFLDLKIGELSEKADGIVKSLTLGELMTIDGDSSKVLQALKDYALDTVYEEDGETIKTHSISHALKTLPITSFVTTDGGHIWDYLGGFTIEDLGQAVSDMTVADVIDTDDPDCHTVIKKLATTKISDIGTAIGDVLEDTTIGEIIDIDENDPTVEPILLALKDVYLDSQSLNTKLSSLSVEDVFSDFSTGILGLVPSNTLLKELPNVLAAEIENTNLYRLESLGVYSFTFEDDTNLEIKAYVYNQTPQSIVNGYIKVVENPLSAINLGPKSINFSGAILDQNAIDNLVGFESGITLKLSENTVIPEETVFSSLFNIDTSVYTLTIGENTSVDLNGGWGYMFLKGNINDPSNITSVDGETINGIYVNAVKIEYGN